MKLSITKFRDILKRIIFNPKKGVDKIIVDHSDPEYYARRAMDLLQESFDSTIETKQKTIQYESAMRLLLVAIAKNEHEVSSANRK